MATYHGITKALCLTCGYASNDDTTLEMWNDYGDCPSPAHSEDTETTLWVLSDGSIARVSHSDEGAAPQQEHTVLSGEEAAEAHAKVDAALAARTSQPKGA